MGGWLSTMWFKYNFVDEENDGGEERAGEVPSGAAVDISMSRRAPFFGSGLICLDDGGVHAIAAAHSLEPKLLLLNRRVLIVD